MATQYGVIIGIIFCFGLYYTTRKMVDLVKNWLDSFRDGDERLKIGDFKSESDSDTESDSE